MKKYRDPVAVIVSRKTKGAAFNPPPEGYGALIARVKSEVIADQKLLSPADFAAKYEMWLW